MDTSRDDLNMTDEDDEDEEMSDKEFIVNRGRVNRVGKNHGGELGRESIDNNDGVYFIYLLFFTF